MSKGLVINYREGRGYKTSGRGGRKSSFTPTKKGEERRAEKVLAMLEDMRMGDGGCKQF